MTNVEDLNSTDFFSEEHTDADTVETAESEPAAKLFEAETPELPGALYPMQDGSYDTREHCEAERAVLAEKGVHTLPWGKGALLLNPHTHSYLTPFGFKAFFEHNASIIRKTFKQAGLETDKSYFVADVPDILIHWPDGRFSPSSSLPAKDRMEALPLHFREEDIYLQNFNHDGTKKTGSYTSYARASLELKEHHAEVLSCRAVEELSDVSAPGATQQAADAAGYASAERVFKRPPTDRGRRGARMLAAGQRPGVAGIGAPGATPK